ncbi:helix-turn-helix domain-containing protein [Anaerostipes caccae]|uniref:helix-turn-helix domain-containing protein n=1 Tax=Anaerostipes caccae TaxID=105841 RepID=UPI00241BF0DC|nr:helix-turn-helix transcriptional regulator [Anaerostipes caccae]
MYEIFSKLLQEFSTTPYKVSKATGVSQSTLSDWKRGISTPKQDKLQKIADHFHVSLEYLMTGKEKEGGETYYINEETREIAQDIFENKDLRMLFDVAKDSTPERLKAYYNMIRELERQEKGED